MTQLINNIAAAAALEANNLRPESFEKYDPKWFAIYNNKYAELLVQECINVVADGQFYDDNIRERICDQFNLPSVSYLKWTKGDLLKMAHEGEFDFIVHGCNCHCTMGSGIARQIREIYPQAYAADCKTKPGDKNKLGSFTYSQAKDKNDRDFTIINAYTQFNFNRGGANDDVFEYDAFQSLLDAWARGEIGGAKIGFPMIGMGLAGGDKERILDMLEKFARKVEAKGGSVTMVEFI